MSDDDEDKKPKSKPKPKRAPKIVITVPTTFDDGWVAHPPSLLYKPNPDAQGGTKIAAIDMDGTLILRRSNAKYGPLDVNDWKWFNRAVIPTLKDLVAEGYKILIISNQGGIKSALAGAMSVKVRGLADNFLEELEAAGVAAQVIMATQDDENRKPNGGMWEFFTQHMNQGVVPNIAESFFVGDAAGRPEDINDGAASDKDFADRLGLKFKLPEEFFKVDEASVSFNAKLSDAFQELADFSATENVFKAKAYRTVAAAIDKFPETITSAKQLKSVKGVGKSSMLKIEEFLETGTMAALEELRAGAGTKSVVTGKKAAAALPFM